MSRLLTFDNGGLIEGTCDYAHEDPIATGVAGPTPYKVRVGDDGAKRFRRVYAKGPMGFNWGSTLRPLWYGSTWVNLRGSRHYVDISDIQRYLV